jgi:carbon monoxide dehydrogenase subunit G
VPDGGFELTYELELRRSPDAVFALLADPESFRAVDPAMLDYGPSGPLTAGGEGWFRHRRGVMTARTTWRVTELDPPRRLEVAISGSGYEMTESAQLEATKSGTRATFIDRVWPTTLPGRLLVALSSGIMRRDLRARAQRLRAMLEGSNDPAA